MRIVHIEPREVEITNPKKSKIKYWTYVISGYENFIDSNEE
jgi:hypothetical protein